MKKILFLGFSLLCLSNLSAMDKITEEDFKQLKGAYKALTGPSNGMFSKVPAGEELRFHYKWLIFNIITKYQIQKLMHHNGRIMFSAMEEDIKKNKDEWISMLSEMGENIEKNKGYFRKFVDRCTIS